MPEKGKMANFLPYPKTHDEAEALKREYAKAMRIEKMHKLYGVHPGAKCGNCTHLVVNHCSKDYFKCVLYGVSRGMTTDWRKGWDACGKFEGKESRASIWKRRRLRPTGENA